MGSRLLYRALVATLASCSAASGDEAELIQFVPNPARLAHLSTPERELLLEYPAHFNRLREFYQSLAMTGYAATETRQTPSGEWRASGRLSGQYKCLGYQSFRVEFRNAAGNKRLAIVNPEEWYVYRTNRAGEYFVEAHGRTHRNVLDSRFGGFAFNNYPHQSGALHSAMCDRGESAAKVHRVVERTDSDGDRLVEVTIHTPLRDGARELTVVSFLRDREWATKELVFATAKPVSQEYAVGRSSRMYGEDVSGIPLLSEAVDYPTVSVPFSDGEGNPMSEYLPGASEDPLSRDRVVISKIEPGAPPLSEFKPLPQLSKIRPSVDGASGSWRGWLLLLNALLLAMLGLYLTKRRNQSDANHDDA